MKHTIVGKHGHMYQVDFKKKDKDGWYTKTKICVSAKAIADADYAVESLNLRQKISRKWNVCCWCWGPLGTDTIVLSTADKKKVLGYECSVDKCPGWKRSGKKSDK